MTPRWRRGLRHVVSGLMAAAQRAAIMPTPRANALMAFANHRFPFLSRNGRHANFFHGALDWAPPY